MSHKYMDAIRAYNKRRIGKCAYCDKDSIDFIAEGAIIKYVCKTHAILHGGQHINDFE